MREEAKKSKYKISIDLNAEFMEAIERYKTVVSMNGIRQRKTTTEIINSCVSILLNAPETFRKSLVEYAQRKISEYNPGSIQECSLNEEIKKWEELYLFLAHNREVYKTPASYKRCDFSDGYLIVPEDWIFLNPEDANADSSKYPMIIEFRNGDRYHIPHFFFLNTSKNLAVGDENKFIRIASERYTPLKELLPYLTRPIKTEDGTVINTELLLSAPVPYFCSFPKYGVQFSRSMYGELWVSRDTIEFVEKYGLT